MADKSTNSKSSTSSSSNSTMWRWIGIGVVVIVVIWLIFALFGNNNSSDSSSSDDETVAVEGTDSNGDEVVDEETAPADDANADTSTDTTNSSN